MLIEILRIENFDKILSLLQEYKKVINEKSIDDKQADKIKNAILNGSIIIYTILEGDEIIGMCSISTIFSTYRCETIGVFDDFFIKPEYRKKGYARELVNFVLSDMKAKKINSIMLGCSDIDKEMYKSLGFNMEIGNLLSWDGESKTSS